MACRQARSACCCGRSALTAASVQSCPVILALSPFVAVHCPLPETRNHQNKTLLYTGTHHSCSYKALVSSPILGQQRFFTTKREGQSQNSMCIVIFLVGIPLQPAQCCLLSARAVQSLHEVTQLRYRPIQGLEFHQISTSPR